MMLCDNKSIHSVTHTQTFDCVKYHCDNPLDGWKDHQQRRADQHIDWHSKRNRSIYRRQCQSSARTPIGLSLPIKILDALIIQKQTKQKHRSGARNFAATHFSIVCIKTKNQLIGDKCQTCCIMTKRNNMLENRQSINMKCQRMCVFFGRESFFGSFILFASLIVPTCSVRLTRKPI